MLIDRKRLFEILAHLFPEIIGKFQHYSTIADLELCENCKEGRILKIYREHKAPFEWCETCRKPKQYKN